MNNIYYHYYDLQITEHEHWMSNNIMLINRNTNIYLIT